MPYIDLKRRDIYEQFIYFIVENLTVQIYPNHDLEELIDIIEVAGDYNYIVSSIIWRLFNKNKRYSTGDSLMADLEDARFCLDNDCEPESCVTKTILYLGRKFTPRQLRGTLRCIEHEYYRRELGMYENVAILKNGDIREVQ
jgi:hypothetical protein